LADSSIETIQLTLSSDLKEVDKIVKLLENIGDKYQIDSDMLGSIVIATTEAVTNAIRHGNNEDKTKIVNVHFDIYSTKVKVLIKDQGNGFIPEELPDPLAEENLHRNSGRGVYLIRMYMDNVSISADSTGTTIVMEKQVEIHLK